MMSVLCNCVNSYLITAGTKGRNKGEFANLQGVATSDTGNVLIADSNNQCVQVKPNNCSELKYFYSSKCTLK